MSSRPVEEREVFATLNSDMNVTEYIPVDLFYSGNPDIISFNQNICYGDLYPPELIFESCLNRKDVDMLEANSAVESESNSVVESLITQSSKGSGIIETSVEERRLEQRQKQIDYGKNTIGYLRYISSVPKENRRYPDPVTPDRYSKCSKRAWDGLVRGWRRKLHQWDPPN